MNKLTSDIFTANLAQANLARKNDFADFIKKKTAFDNKLKNLNKNITSNKTKIVLAENELNKLLKKIKLLSAKDYSFFLGKSILQAMVDLKICLFIKQHLIHYSQKNTKALIMFLVGNQRGHGHLNLHHYIQLS